MNTYQMQTAAIANYTELNNEFRSAAEKMASTLTDLAIREMRHQVGPRGVEEYKGYEITLESIEGVLGEVLSDVRIGLQNWMIAR